MTKRLHAWFYAICTFLWFCNQSFAEANSVAGESPQPLIGWNEPVECLKTDPEYEEMCKSLLFTMGNTLLNDLQFGPAIDRYSQVLRMQEYHNVYANRGVAYAGREEYRLARKDIKRALEIHPGLHQSWANLARVEIKLGHPKSALIAATTAITLMPDSAPYYTIRSDVYLHMRRSKLAAADAKRAKELDDAQTAHMSDDANRVAGTKDKEDE